jgi:ABC-type sugar transport system permease subunit
MTVLYGASGKVQNTKGANMSTENVPTDNMPTDNEEYSSIKAQLNELADAIKAASNDFNTLKTNIATSENLLSSAKTSHKELTDAIRAASNDFNTLKADSSNSGNLLSSAKKNSDDIQKAYNQIFLTTNENSMNIINNIQTSYKNINNLYNELLQIKNSIVGYSKAIKGEVLQPQPQPQSVKNNDAIIFDENDKLYYKKNIVPIPGMFDNIKTDLDLMKNRLDEYDKIFNDIIVKNNKDLELLKQEIKSLLPSAMATGLASSYEDARKEHRWNILIWSCLFIVSIFSVFAIAHFMKISYPDLQPWQSSLYNILQLIPFEVPAVWLAILSAKKINQHSRLFEEYLHKWSMTRTFVGMQDAVEKVSQESNLRETLYNETLKAYSKNPSQILDANASSDSPVELVRDMAKTTSEVISATKDGASDIAADTVVKIAKQATN